MYKHHNRSERYNNTKLVDFERKFLIPLDEIDNYVDGKMGNVNKYRVDNIEKMEQKKKDMEDEAIYLKYKMIEEYDDFLKKSLYTFDDIKIEMSNKNYNSILNTVNKIIEKKYKMGKVFKEGDFKDESLDLQFQDDHVYEFVWNENKRMNDYDDYGEDELYQNDNNGYYEEDNEEYEDYDEIEDY